MIAVKRLGLTGGIAAGKSEVARLFVQRGIPVIDMDQLSRELLDTDKRLQNQVIESLGTSFLTEGKIDRLKLKNLVFSDPQKKKLLESLIHPKVREQFEVLAQKEGTRGHKLVLCEAALLIESGYGKTLDGLVVVLAPEELRKSRLKTRDQLSDELIERIFQSQVSDQERIQAANYIIQNDSKIQTLSHQVEALLALWKHEGLL